LNSLSDSGLTVSVTRKWAGFDSAWEQEKLEARKLLEKCAESHLSGARIVRRFFIVQDSLSEKRYCHQHAFDFSEFKTGRRIMIHQ